MWDKINVTMKEAKMVVITISFIVASFTGAYTIVSEYFVTKIYATELVREVENKLSELKKQTADNKKILIEMRMIRMEEKISRGETLTPTEQRVYNKLKKDYENMLDEF